MLRIDNLHTVLETDSGLVRAVEAVTLAIERGETFALVGESGCGKSMTALSILRLLPDNGRVERGAVRLAASGREIDLVQLPESRMRDVRGRRVSIIFQEPSTSLNPVMPVGEQIVEVIERHTPLKGEAARAKAIEWLQRVGLPEPERRIDDYPFQLSGGQKQRVMIAIALAAEPDVVIADEPTTALDVTIQKQILDLLKELQRQQGMALLLITHDLGIVATMAHRIALMYAGEVVEVAETREFFARPLHPYAQLLLAALPDTTKRGQPLAAIPGTVPRLDQAFAGCRFVERCPRAMDTCKVTPPSLYRPIGDHGVRCLLYEATPPFEKGGPGGISSSATAEQIPPTPLYERGVEERRNAGDHRTATALPPPFEKRGPGGISSSATAEQIPPTPLYERGVEERRNAGDHRTATASPPPFEKGGLEGILSSATAEEIPPAPLYERGVEERRKAGDHRTATALPPPFEKGGPGGILSSATAEEIPPAPLYERGVDFTDRGRAEPPPLLDVRDYKVYFPIRRGLLKRVAGYVKAVDGISFSLAAGRTLALVGESGCGKTTTGKALLQLLRGAARVEGRALLEGQPLDALEGDALREARRKAQIIFQDPFASLNPRMRVAEILEEGVASLRPEISADERRQRAAALLEKVGLRPESMNRFPHEFSGGQRQRIAIARALAVEPKLIVCDEPTSALDVSVQAQILNLLAQLQRELGVAYLFITHNFGVVEYLAHDIAVMQAGRIVEAGAAEQVLERPRHAYTKALLAAVPRLKRAA